MRKIPWYPPEGKPGNLQLRQEQLGNLFSLSPEDVAEFLRRSFSVALPDRLDTEEEKRAAAKAMNELTAWYCYFKEMETSARILKRQAKKDRREADRLLSIEEIFETYKKICDQNYECLTRQMTLKRLEIDEMRMLGRTV